MADKSKFLDENYILERIELDRKYGILTENIARNESIKIRYRILKRQLKSGRKAREQLADENYISIKAIEAILYKKNPPTSTS